MSRPTVITWRERYKAQGLDGLADRPRLGRPKRLADAALITATLGPPPEDFPSLAGRAAPWQHLGIGDATVAGLAPLWRPTLAAGGLQVLD